VIYPGDDGELHRSSHWQVDERADAASDAYPVAELYRAFAGQDVKVSGTYDAKTRTIHVETISAAR